MKQILETPDVIINPYRFSAGGVSLPRPIHFWDLDNTTTGVDDLGSGGTGSPWARLSQGGVAVNVTTGSAAPGGVGECLDFVTGYYEYDDAGTTDIAWDGARDEMTMTCWYQIRFTSTAKNQLISWRTLTTTARLAQMQVENSTDDYLGGAFFDDGGSVSMFLNDPDVNNTTDQWYFGAITFKAGTGNIYRVTQGTDTLVLLETETNASLDAFSTTAQPFALGARAETKTATSAYHRGYLWGVGIWDEELSTAQLQAIYDQQTNGDTYADFTWT